MSSTNGHATSETPGESPREERYWNASRLGLGVVVIAMVAMWGWIYLFASRDNPDRFAQREFSNAAEPICSAAHGEIDGLLSPRQTTTPAERAVQVALGTKITEQMVADLHAATSVVTDPEEREILDAWFADWDVYIADRWLHVDRLSGADDTTPGRDLAFILSAQAAGGIYTQRIDGLANVNDMASCNVPGDI